MRATGVVGLIVTLSSACATTYSTHRCPNPIGEIVRQDCGDYRVRYETARAKLSFSLGFLKLGTDVSEQKLRDPSELVQVMMHQMLALCHDYNSCRVTNLEYRTLRDAHDRTFTAVMAILDQLKAPGLSQGNRAELFEQVLVLLKSPATSPDKPQPTTKPKPPRARGLSQITDGFFREPWTFWYDSKYRPPKPPTVAKGLPFAIELLPFVKGGEFEVFAVRLWGDVQADDEAHVVGDNGARMRCSVKRGNPRKPEGMVECRAPRGERLPRGKRLRLEYTPGATGTRHDFGVVDVDPIPPTRDAWLAYQPDPIRVDPITRERPWVIVWRAGPKRAEQAAARCSVGGAPVVVKGVAAIRADSRRWVFSGVNRTVFAFPLPYVLPYDGAAPSGDESLGEHAGDWRCVVSLDGEPTLEVRFTVNRDGTIETHARQQGRPGDVASPWWLINTREF